MLLCQRAFGGDEFTALSLADSTNTAVQIVVTGPNARTQVVTTDENGTTAFLCTGTVAGTDRRVLRNASDPIPLWGNFERDLEPSKKRVEAAIASILPGWTPGL